MNIQVDSTSSNLASAMLNSKIRPRAVVGYGVKIFRPSPPNYVTRSPGKERLSFIFKVTYFLRLTTMICTAKARMLHTIRKVTCSLSRFTRLTKITSSLLSTTPTQYHSEQSGIRVTGNLLKVLLSVTLN